MQIYLSVDDTDNLTSIGSGQLAENLTEALLNEGLAQNCSNITRHQLYYHDDIPYTSHNSAMCFIASINPSSLTDLVKFSGHYLQQHAALGSDPGLCIAQDTQDLNREALIGFGEQAKSTILNKDKAYQLATRTKVHLSEYGGTGDGVIGALAAIGLRIQGNDGRFRGWFNIGKAGELTTATKLCKHPSVMDVIGEDGQPVSRECPIRITDEKIKTILKNHIQIIPVVKQRGATVAEWATLSSTQVKKY